VHIKLFILDLSLILIWIVEYHHLHRAFKGVWVLEVDYKTSFAKHVGWLFPSFNQLTLEFDEFFWLDSLSAFFRNFICSSWSFNL